jgi:hypothetical protein
MMGLGLDPAKLRHVSIRAWLLRLAFGGLVTTLAGLVGAAYGPAVGGLFLAFPSISMASLTLIQRQEGKNAAGIDALGASMGGLGLLGFGLVVWVLAPRESAALTLIAATCVWLLLSTSLWLASRRIRHRHRHRARDHQVRAFADLFGR